MAPATHPSPALPPDESRLAIAPHLSVPLSMIEFAYSRSGGPGGQNVNKLATRAQLRVALADLRGVLGDAVTQRLAALAGWRVTAGGELLITAEESRSQSDNRAACLSRLRDLIRQSLKAPKLRKPTRPGRGAVRRRREHKARHGNLKRQRRSRPDADG
jgi:ribosome-associated protein